MQGDAKGLPPRVELKGAHWHIQTGVVPAPRWIETTGLSSLIRLLLKLVITIVICSHENICILHLFIRSLIYSAYISSIH